MSKFVELTDYDASIHRDILDALVREDEMEMCIRDRHRGTLHLFGLDLRGLGFLAAQVKRVLFNIPDCEILIPVSYTHLDVYKRQGLCRAPRCIPGLSGLCRRQCPASGPGCTRPDVYKRQVKACPPFTR